MNRQISITIEKTDTVRDILDNLASILSEAGDSRGIDDFKEKSTMFQIVKTSFDLPEIPTCPDCGSCVDVSDTSCYCSECNKSFYMSVLYDIGESFE